MMFIEYYDQYYDEALAHLKREREKAERLLKENPEVAKRESKERLIRIGLIDEDGNRLPPYREEDS